MPRARIGPTELYFQEEGNGPAVLCIPGALGTGASDFRTQVQTWSPHFKVIAPDPRGYGRSRPPDRDFSIDFYRQDALEMAQLMDELGHRTYSLAGFSDGANVAVLLAARLPRKVSKLVIWGGNSFYTKTDLNALDKTRLISTWPKRMRESLEKEYGVSLQAMWNAYCDSIRNRFEGNPDVCLSELCLVHCPTLILHGGRDPVVSPRHAQVLRDGIKNARMSIIPDGRHSIHKTHTDEFNTLVLAFLRKGVG
jgi:valacyclovir hydrolase